MASDSYCSLDCVIVSVTPIARNKLDATRLANVLPCIVISGTPDHRQSLAVV